MKINVSDTIRIKKQNLILMVKVEDASKPDIIRGKLEAIEGEAGSAYEVGGLYEFSRGDIEDAENTRS